MIRRIHNDSRGTCGMPRVHAEWVAGGCPVGRKRVARPMRESGLTGVSRHRGTCTARAERSHRTAADREAYRRDRRKDALLQEHGYLVLRFLAEDLGTRLDAVLDEVVRALAGRMPSS